MQKQSEWQHINTVQWETYVPNVRRRKKETSIIQYAIVSKLVLTRNKYLHIPSLVDVVFASTQQ